MNQSLATVLAAQPNVYLVCVLGVAVVFVGLIAMVGLVAIMNAISDLAAKKSRSKEEACQAATPVPAAIPNRQEILAAVCAAVAEENGTDISAIRVISFKKL